MAETDSARVPMHTFRFLVDFVGEAIDGKGGGQAGGANEDLCEGAFTEVTGLEASMEPKAIKEGGRNYGVHQRAGQVSFATVVLKRGLAQARDLWAWWALFAGAQADKSSSSDATVSGAYAHRLTVRITLQDISGTPRLRWRLERAMPVKYTFPLYTSMPTLIALTLGLAV